MPIFSTFEPAAAIPIPMNHLWIDSIMQAGEKGQLIAQRNIDVALVAIGLIFCSTGLTDRTTIA